MKVIAKDCTLHVGKGMFGPGTVVDIPDEKEALALIERGFASAIPVSQAAKPVAPAPTSQAKPSTGNQGQAGKPAVTPPKPNAQTSTGPKGPGGNQGSQT